MSFYQCLLAIFEPWSGSLLGGKQAVFGWGALLRMVENEMISNRKLTGAPTSEDKGRHG